MDRELASAQIVNRKLTVIRRKFERNFSFNTYVAESVSVLVMVACFILVSICDVPNTECFKKVPTESTCVFVTVAKAVWVFVIVAESV